MLLRREKHNDGQLLIHTTYEKWINKKILVSNTTYARYGKFLMYFGNNACKGSKEDTNKTLNKLRFFQKYVCVVIIIFVALSLVNYAFGLTIN